MTAAITMHNRSARTDTTTTIPTPVRRTDTMDRNGSIMAFSWESARGTAGVGAAAADTGATIGAGTAGVIAVDTDITAATGTVAATVITVDMAAAGMDTVAGMDTAAGMDMADTVPEPIRVVVIAVAEVSTAEEAASMVVEEASTAVVVAVDSTAVAVDSTAEAVEDSMAVVVVDSTVVAAVMAVADIDSPRAA